MRIDKLATVLFTIALSALVACSDDGGGGGDDADDGTTDGTEDDGTEDDGTEDDGADDGTPDGGTDGDGSTGACLSAPREQVGESEEDDWPHVAEGSEIDYANEPPAFGPHYGNNWGSYSVHDGELARGYWVHNIEHGGIVLLHSPDASQEVVDGLVAAFDAIEPDPDPACAQAGGHKRTLVAADAQLTTPVAVIAAYFVMDGTCVDEDAQAAILQFVQDHRGNGPENECDDGTIE
jgi:hypothetical protein